MWLIKNIIWIPKLGGWKDEQRLKDKINKDRTKTQKKTIKDTLVKIKRNIEWGCLGDPFLPFTFCSKLKVDTLL